MGRAHISDDESYRMKWKTFYTGIAIAFIVFVRFQPISLAQNLITNGDFETWSGGLPTDWVVETAVTITQETAQVHSGIYSAGLQATSSDNRGLYQLIPVTAGTIYHFQAYVFGTGAGSNGLGLYVNWLDSGGGTIGGEGTFYNSGSGSWEFVSSGEITAPVDAITARCRIRCYANSAFGGYLDDVAFYDYSGPTPTQVFSNTPVPTDTPSPIPTGPTHTPTNLPTLTPTPTNTPTMTPTATQTPLCLNNGDVIPDGSLTAGDAQFAFLIALGLYSPSYFETCAADCNGDSYVTAGDAQKIFLTALGLSDCVDPTPSVTPISTPLEIVYIPSGTYIRGSDFNEPCRNTDETRHPVILTRPFCMMKTEVTRQMWADLKEDQPTLPDDPSDNLISPSSIHPVQQLSWFEAVLFANLMSIRYGYDRCYYKDSGFVTPVDSTNYTTGDFYCDFDAMGYRLPTEAEWEYVCRAGTTDPFSCIEPNYSSSTCHICVPDTLATLEQYAVFCANRIPEPGGADGVGSKLHNPWGIHDLHGNIREWCWDWYENYPSQSVTDPVGPFAGQYRVIRGGYFLSDAAFCRSAKRSELDPENFAYTIGFRLVRTVISIPTYTPTPIYTNTPTSTPTPSHTPTSTPTRTPTRTPTNTPTQTPINTPTPVPTGFVYIPAGTYTQGSPSTEACRNSNEDPQRQVTISRGFHMMRTEVTRQMWADLKAVQPTLPNDPSWTDSSPTMNHPVQMVTWYEAVLFTNLMSLRDGYTRCYYKDSGFTIPVDATNYTTGDLFCNFNANGYRLPTEAEWEYACRAGTTGAFSCDEPNYNGGNCSSCTYGTHPTLEQYCVYCANSGYIAAAVVGSKLPNPAGLYDMHGNVNEWCWDWYGWYPSGSVTDPTGPSTGSSRVSRGGGWFLIPTFCRSAFRHHITPTDRDSGRGFRLLRTAD